MSDDDDLDYTVDDLVERYLLFLRGRGPEPDLLALPPGRQAAVRAQLEIVAALADRDPDLPAIEDDPVAIRLGLVESAEPAQAVASQPTELHDDGAPVIVALQDLEFRFRDQVLFDFAPRWTPPAPPELDGVAKCTALGETIAVFLAAVEEWAREPATVARFFREHPDVSTVALVSGDAERAVVLTAADAHLSVDPVQGWLAPHSPSSPEPLGIVLGRHLDRGLPDWERVADLDALLGLGDVTETASQVSSAQVAQALRAKPRLAYRKQSLLALGALDPSHVVAVVVEVQSGRLAGDELVERVARLAEAAAP